MSLGIRYRADKSSPKYYLNDSFKNPDGTQHFFKSVNKAERMVMNDLNYVILSSE